MAQSDYGTFGSVPSVTPSAGGVTPLSVRANPQDFGAQVGAGKEALGGAIEKAGSDVGELAQKYQGMVNETAATNAETALIKSYAAGRADFMSSEGAEATQKQGPYLQKLNDDFTQARAALPPGAQRMFDMTGRRLLANYTSEGITYGVAQGKKAYSNSLLQNANVYADSMKDPINANNPAAIDEAVAAGVHAHTSAIDEDSPGVTKDNETGVYGFANTKVGDLQKATLQADIDNHIGTVYSNSINTVADQDPLKASKMYEDNKDKIPPAWQAAISSALAPKVTNAYIHTASVNAMSELMHGYSQEMSAPSSQVSNGPNPFNLGNVKTAQGASAGTPEFSNPATPVDGVVLTANNLRDNYKGLTLSQIAEKWAPSSENKTGDWLKNVSASSGISPDTVPNLNDAATLKKVLTGISVAEKSPQDRAAFTDDVLTQGVNSSLAGGKANMATPTEKSLLPGEPAQNFGKNQDGTMLTPADYNASHRYEKIQEWRNWARNVKPGDTTFENAVAERINGQINQSISDQTNGYKQDRAKVMEGVLGKLTKGGTPPATVDELYALPGMKQIIDQLPTRDKESQDFFNNLPTTIARYQRRNTDTNSPNGYDTILRTLMPYDQQHPNGIYSQGQLDKMMGSTGDDAINAKDYHDAKKSIDMGSDLGKWDTWKSIVSEHMKAISAAGGNLDGGGQQRAVGFYNAAMAARESAKEGEQPSPLITTQMKKDLEDSASLYTISRSRQAALLRESAASGKVPTFESPDDPMLSRLPSGSKYMSPDGRIWTKK